MVMMRPLTAGVVALCGLALCAGTPAWAEEGQKLSADMPAISSGAPTPPARRDAVLELWQRARTQIDTVCRRHELEQRHDLAARCYDEVAAMLRRAAPRPVATAPLPPPRVGAAPRRLATAAKRAPAERVAAAPRPLTVAEAQPRAHVRGGRCSTLLCSSFVVLGVGF
jgi:hypothetical protein